MLNFSQDFDEAIYQLESGQYEEGLKKLTTLELRANEESEWLDIIHLYLALGFVDKVKNLMSKLNESSVDTKRVQAEIEYKEGNYEKAQEIMHDIINSHPNEQDYVFMAQLYFDDGLPEVSLNYINKALQLNDSESFYFYQKGLFTFELGEIEEALTNFEQAITLAPDEKIYHLALGEALANFGRFDQALEQFDEVLERDPNQQEALFLKAITLIQVENLEEGINNLEKLAQLQPENIDVLINLADAYEKNQQLNKGLDVLKKCLALDENYLPALRRIGQIYLYQEEWEKAKEILNKALMIDPEDNSLKLMYAKILKAYGDVKEAIEQYEVIHEQTPFEVEVCKSLGDLYVKTGQMEKAIHCYEAQLEVEKDYKLLNQLAACYAETKDYKKALEMIRHSLKLEPNQESLNIIKEQLESLVK